MEWTKLKNIIILILLLANLFLLIMTGVRERGTARYQEQTLTDAVQVLEKNGIRLDSAHLPAELNLAPMTVERNQESEASLAAALLEECAPLDLGSGRYAYQSSLGRAEFRSDGSFSFTFFEDAFSVAENGSEETHALTVLQQIDFTGTLVFRQNSGGQTKLVLRENWRNLPVFSCSVTLEYEDGCLRSITGQRLMGTPQLSAEKAELISAPTALLRTLNGIRGLGDVCSEITAMTPAYLLSETSDSAVLIPIWYVTTDTGAYSLNALTGALERVSEPYA